VSRVTERELDPEAVRLGATIRALREAHGLNMAQLAALIGLSRPYVNNVELGIKRASPRMCRSVADTLGVPLAALTVAGYERIRELA